MPRSGWVALGAVVAALGATQPWLGQSWLAQPLTWLLLGASWLGAIARWRRPAGARRQRPESRWLIPLVLGGAGALVIGLRLMLGPVPAASGPLALPLGTGPWTGVVEAIGNPRTGQQTATVRLATRPPIAVAASVPPDPVLGIGASIRMSGRLQPLPDDDYGTFLHESGIAATLKSRTLEIVEAAPSAIAVIDRIRRIAADALALTLPEPEAGLAAGILVGLRDRVDQDLAKAFTTAGVSHIVAISGWNIAIVAALVGAALRTWPRRRRSVASLLLIALYTVLTGASASVVRAALMTSAVTLARESGRAGSASAALASAAVLILLADPATVGDAGFQLSSLATAGLIAWGTPLAERLRSWRGGRLPGWLAESLAVSFAAEAATLPVVLLAFGRLAILAPAVNLVVVPLVPSAMAGGTLALLAGSASMVGLPREAAVLLSLPGWMALAAMDWIVRGAAALPGASVVLTPPLNATAAALVAACVLIVAVAPARQQIFTLGSRTWPPLLRRLRPIRGAGTRHSGVAAPIRPPRPITNPGSRRRLAALSDRRTRFVAIALAASVAGLVLIAAHRADGTIRIEVLDVGQGDAILVQGDRGARMLVDGGPDPGRLLVALDERLPPWDRRIDLLVLTHPHEDHVAGMARLLERYRVRRIAEPGMIGPGPGYAAFAGWLVRHDRRVERLSTGDSLGLDSIAFRVLWPDAGAVPLRPADTGTGINNVSIVLLGQVAAHRFLLMGDVEESIDLILLTRGLPRVDVLKVAHHGSRTSSTDAFLAAVRPRIAVVSAGLHNPYGHPAPATIQRLEAHGASIFRTDLDGTVEVALEGDGWVASAEHPRPAPEALAPSRPTLGMLALFRCTLPVPAGGATQVVAGLAPTTNGPTAGLAGEADGLLYDRPDVRARPSGGSSSAPEPESPALAPPPFPRRCGDRRLARQSDRGSRHRGGPAAGRGRGTPPRRRQVVAAARSRLRASTRRGLGRVAVAARPPRARPRGGEPPRDPPRERGTVPPLVVVCDA
jgi:competence protein ComEC